MEIELIFYTCLILIILRYFDQFILWIHPSINVSKDILTPMIIDVIFAHRFKYLDAPSIMEDNKMALFRHIFVAIRMNLAMACFKSWMDPSSDYAKELFFVLSSLHY
ncbi:hypothetical protein TSUD_05980 [Trifolium subterraneum]|uniref:Uncharacterized protein n=1 Tax=Trifolium subterraneum TaxID=3900 RepID=A0A2Z6NC54_TRISU|nr:hypothetical protein TSUD_05980 [Trifolium subterraneum]